MIHNSLTSYDHRVFTATYHRHVQSVFGIGEYGEMMYVYALIAPLALPLRSYLSSNQCQWVYIWAIFKDGSQARCEANNSSCDTDVDMTTVPKSTQDFCHNHTVSLYPKMCKQEEQIIVIKSDESSLDESSFRNFTHHAAEVKTSIPKINKVSTSMTCTSDTLLQDDHME